MSKLAVQSLSKPEAQAIALHQLGFTSQAQKTQPNPLEAIDRLSLFQIDSVNVFERAHYLPAFSRLGKYDKTLLDEAHSPKQTAKPATKPPLIEYWAHEAALIRVEELALHQWRMHKYRQKPPSYSADFAAENQKLFEWLAKYLEDVGPQTASEVEHPANVRKPGTWWHHNDIKRALEVMFLRGELVSAGRKNFSRRYGLPEQILPAEVHAALNQDNYDEAADRKALLLRAANIYGVASARDLADYHRQHFANAKPMIDELLAEGRLVPVQVDGIDLQHFAPSDLILNAPEHRGTTVVSPFDPLVWHRPRTEALFDFHYRIEIYTPEPKRIFGYYTLPILHNGKIVGRIDLKSDRQNSCLVAKASWHELWLNETQVSKLAGAMRKHLKEIAAWQGLKQIEIAQRGNLAAALNRG